MFANESTLQILSAADVEWGALNPARGDASPRAANLWGDRESSGASGFLVKFVDGFSSPPHIHNITYRGIVISGLVHNDDPAAEKMWLPAGSFWVQPAGEVHITSAEGDHNMAYIEIDSGPYLVQPESEAFDNGERPVNVHSSNFVWLNAEDIKWLPTSGSEAETAFLWGERGENKLNGTLLKLPSGFSGEIQNNASEFHAVVIKGPVTLFEGELTAGSYFGLKSQQTIPIESGADVENILYIRANNRYHLMQTSTSP